MAPRKSYPAALKAKGVRLGRPVENAGDVAQRAVELRRQGMPIAQVAERLNAEGYHTARGGRWNPSSVYHMLGRHLQIRGVRLLKLLRRFYEQHPHSPRRFDPYRRN